MNTDSEILLELMKEVYPAAYSHYWEDSGDWYVKANYSKENLLKELKEKKSQYYFVIFENEIIGNFRIIWDKKLKGFNDKRTVKLHRLYLHSKTQGNGIGKKLMNWLKEEAIKKQYELIWLDAMNEQEQAFKFYEKLGYTYSSHCFLNFELMYDKVRKMSQLYKELT